MFPVNGPLGGGGSGGHPNVPVGVLADSLRSKLISAINEQEPFDVATGQPVALLPTVASSRWLDLCVTYVAARWEGAAAKTCDHIANSLATATIAMTEVKQDRPDAGQLRKAFLWRVLPANKDAERPPELAGAIS